MYDTKVKYYIFGDCFHIILSIFYFKIKKIKNIYIDGKKKLICENF